MAFFEKLASSITEAGSAIHKRAKDYSANAQLDAEISTLEKSIERCYRNLGEMYYNNSTGADTIFDASDIITEIYDAKKRIQEIQAEKFLVVGKRICPQCAAEIDVSSKFCQFCGLKLEPIVFKAEGKAGVSAAEDDVEEVDDDFFEDEPESNATMDAEFVPYTDEEPEDAPEAEAADEFAEVEEETVFTEDETAFTEDETVFEEEDAAPAEEEAAPAVEEAAPAEEEAAPAVEEAAPADGGTQAGVCPACGEELEPDAKFCIYCGKELS